MTPEELVNDLLTTRGIVSEEDRECFLHPKYEDMYDPFLMHDMQKSVDRIFLAIKNKEKICIYSDYDADGIPGGVILHDFFKKIGYEHFINYIPHRHTEGYGVHKEALARLKEKNVTLMITVDVGITALDEIAYGNTLGIETIITDHHEPLETLPDAYAIVNPKLGNYPDRMLCGAGVAFKLVQGMITILKTKSFDAAEACLSEASSAGKEKDLVLSVVDVPVAGWEKWLLDMAGLATLSDMVPLVNENRIIAYYGMKVLQKTQRPGLQALFQKSGITLRSLTETDIVFSITPRLNAASRMAHPEDAFKLLATKNSNEGALAAEHLSSLNDERKKIVATIMRDVHKKMSHRKSDQGLPHIVVIGDPSWPAGILGLVASKIIETYAVTVFVWGAEEDAIKGSCRGVGDVSVVQLMQKVVHLLTQFGGHEEAGGFTTTREHIHFLEDACNAQYHETKHLVSKQVTEIRYDRELALSDVTMAHYRALRTLAPFGIGNPKPVFAFKNSTIVSVRQFGKTKEHLEVTFKDSVRAISWYAQPDSFTELLEPGKTITLLAEFDHSVFRGKEELRLMIVDVIH